MRKLTTVVICAVFVLMLSVPALAAGQLQFTVTPSVTQAPPGETVEFEVSVKGDAYSSVGYIPTYDENVWQMEGGKCLTEESMLDEFSPVNGGILALEKSAVRDGVVFCFSMKVKTDAPAGKTTLTGEVAAKDGGTVLNTALSDTVVTIRPQNAPETAQTEATKPAQETVATQQTQPVPPDNIVAVTQPTAVSEATDPTQAIAQDATLPKESVDATVPGKDSVLTIGQGTIPDLGGDDSCVTDDGDCDEEATEPVPKKNDTLLVWIAVIAVVAAGAAAAWFFLSKKKTE